MTATPTIYDVRAFWDRQPCHVKHSRLPVGTRAYFDEVRERRYAVEPHLLRFLEPWRWEGKRVLEVGCGIGTDAVTLALHGAYVQAFDLSRAAVVIARQQALEYGVGYGADRRVDVYQDNVEALFDSPKMDERFDLIYSCGVLHHTPDPLRALRNLRRVAVPGQTTLKILLYHRRSLKVLGARLRGEPVERHAEAQPNCPIARTYTRRQAVDLLASTGWAVQTVQVAHCFRYRLQPYIEGRLELTPFWRHCPELLQRAIDRTLGWHLLIEAKPA